MKIAGIVGLLIPGYLLLKEWAYAGFFFFLTGAVISHIVSGDEFQTWIVPLNYAVLAVLSWYLQPVNRRIPGAEVDKPGVPASSQAH